MDSTTILDRIKEVYGFKTNSQFANFLDVKPTTISSWYARNTFDAGLIYAKCKDIDGNFLFTGKGDVLLDKMVVSEPSVDYMQRQNEDTEHTIVPIFNIEASAGLVALYRDRNTTTPIDYVQIPNIGSCDGAVFVSGDSMYPRLKSGDIILFKLINNVDDVLGGHIYILDIQVDDDVYTLTKWVQKSDKGPDYIKLVSENKHHDDKDIHKSKILKIGIVKGSFRYEL
ncbi:MAG: S24 family peptidase [Putridiphycobacter sp.]|nr:S24 family peptidase [Putridiphycobacter sp.]